MIGELIYTGDTLNQGRVKLNYAFSAETSFNAVTATTFSAVTISGDTIIVAPTGQYQIGSYNALRFPYNNTNIAMGPSAGNIISTGQNNIFVGKYAGGSTTTTTENVYVGSECGKGTDSDYNTYIGFRAGASTSTSTSNVIVGHQTGELTTSASQLVLLGREAGRLLTTGSQNVFIGYQTGYYFKTGEQNVFVGFQAGRGGAAGGGGTNNVAFGRFSLYNITSGNTNTALGNGAGYSNVIGSGNVFVGNGAGYSETGDNTLYISNSSTINPLIYGDFNTGYLRINNILSAQTISATTINTQNMLLIESAVAPSAQSGLMWYSGGTAYIFSGATWADLIALY